MWKDVPRRRRRSGCRIYMISVWRDDRNRSNRSKAHRERSTHFERRADILDGISIYGKDDEELVYLECRV